MRRWIRVTPQLQRQRNGDAAPLLYALLYRNNARNASTTRQGDGSGGANNSSSNGKGQAPQQQFSTEASASSPATDPTFSSSAAVDSGGEAVEPQLAAERMEHSRRGHYNSAYQEQLQRRRSRDGRASEHGRRRRARTATMEEGAWEGGWDESSAAVPAVVHPGQKGLPPLTSPDGRRKVKFSFLARADQREGERDYFSHGTVPNNTPKPLLPMWASSLTSPALGKQRLVEDNWISVDAMGTIPAAETRTFLQWLLGAVESPQPEKEGTQLSLLGRQVEDNVELHLRRSYQRGVYAKRDFQAGEEVFAIPLTATVGRDVSTAGAGASCPWATALNAETLQRHSAAVAQRSLPPYDAVRDVVYKTRRSDFDPIPHPLFIDQLHFALMLACERAEGQASPLHPYLALFGDTPFDDEHIRELHLGVLDPFTHMEYNDHRYRFTHYLRELHKRWWDEYEAKRKELLLAGRSKKSQGSVLVDTQTAGREAGESASAPYAAYPDGSAKTSMRHTSTVDALEMPTDATASDDAAGVHFKAGAVSDASAVVSSEAAKWENDEEDELLKGLKPPPSVEDIEWAFRLVLSRQRILPGLRQSQENLATEATQTKYEERNEQLDAFAKAVMRGKWGFYQHVLGAVDEERLRVNDFDPGDIATLVPLLDMMNHPPNGHANATFAVEMRPAPWDQAWKGRSEGADSREGAVARPDVPHIVVRTAEAVEAMDELTLLFPKCYSVSYTLYRFGFLPLRSREEDMIEHLRANDVDGEVLPLRNRQGLRARIASGLGKLASSLSGGRGRGDASSL